jgi:hypothetical protein
VFAVLAVLKGSAQCWACPCTTDTGCQHAARRATRLSLVPKIGRKSAGTSLWPAFSLNSLISSFLSWTFLRAPYRGHVPIVSALPLFSWPALAKCPRDVLCFSALVHGPRHAQRPMAVLHAIAPLSMLGLIQPELWSKLVTRSCAGFGCSLGFGCGRMHPTAVNQLAGSNFRTRQCLRSTGGAFPKTVFCWLV